MGPRRRTEDDSLPAPAEEAVATGRGERVLAAAREGRTGRWLVVTSWRLVSVSTVAGEGDSVAVELDRPWWHVDGGAWDPDAMRLTATWVDESPEGRWVLEEPGRVPEAFRERVQASVVLMRQLDLGPRRRVRVAVRKDLRDRTLLEQVLPGPGVRGDDAELAAAVVRARAELRDQAGMGPVPR